MPPKIENGGSGTKAKKTKIDTGRIIMRIIAWRPFISLKNK